MPPGDLVTLRDTGTHYVVQPYPAHEQFCVPVVSIAAETGDDKRLVLPDDISPVLERVPSPLEAPAAE